MMHKNASFLAGKIVVPLVVMAISANAAIAQNNALRLGPTNTNTYVTFGATSALGVPTFTVETWFNRQGTGVTTSTGTGGIPAFIPLVTKGQGEADGSNVDENYLLGINTAGNVIAADFEEGAGGTSPGLNHPVSGVTPILNDTWYHAAATYDGSTWRLYLNGVLEAELYVGEPPRSDSIQHAGLGTTLSSTGAPQGYFDGTIDEARIWNVERSITDIRATMNVQNPSHAALVARWGLDEGSGTTVGDSVGGSDGTITGTNYGWVTGAPFDIAPCEGSPDPDALGLDGTNDYVTFGDAAELKLPAFTIETWFKRTGTGTANTTGAGGIAMVPLVTKGAPDVDQGDNRDENFLFGIETSGNVIAADFEEGAGGTSPSQNHPVSGVTPIVNGTWYHAAATYDGTTWNLYLNGNTTPEATLVVGEPVRADSICPAALGTMIKADGSPLGFFDGVLDEVRIWNYARTPAEINANYLSELTSGPGLVARWGLDEGTGTTAADSVGPSFSDGTLTNSPSWVYGGAFGANDPCDDGVFCNGTDTCDRSTLRCDIHAGDPCLGGPECDNVCNETADDCAVTAGTACTPDGNICTDDVCDGAGGCGVDNTAPCDDGLFCNGDDTCAGGICTHAGDPCLGGPECDNVCNEGADNCAVTAGAGCTDDGNVCTDDECDGAGTCSHPNNAAPCDDGLFCNGTDTCAGGICTHAGDPCLGGPECDNVCNEGADNCAVTAGTGCTDDGNVCTDDECDGAGTCSHPDNTAPCDDALFCNGTDTCAGGICTHAGDPCAGGPECDNVCNEVADDCAVAAGTACTPDGNLCTDDECDGAGTCGVNNAAPCDDGLFCNGTDTCAGGICTHTGDPCTGGPECDNVCNEAADDCAVTAGTACTSDGNVCTDDVCDGAGTCGVDNTESCDDGDACTTDDICSGGVCVGGAAIDCPACEACDPLGGCIVAPKDTCRQPVAPLKALLLLKKSTSSDKDKLVWKWIKGENTGFADFGDPVNADDYALCIYDALGGSSSVLLSATAPAGGQCVGRPCWKTLANKGYKYKDKARALDGLDTILLKSGADGRAKIIVKGKGANLGLPSPLGVELPVTVQLQAANSECWEAKYFPVGVKKNDAGQFKAKAGSPSGAFIEVTSGLLE